MRSPLTMALLLVLSAMTATVRAGEIDPGLMHEMRRGAALMQTGQVDTAFETFSALRERFPADPAVLLWQTRAAVASGRGDMARANVRRLLAAYPDHPILRREAHEIFTSLGDNQLAALVPPAATSSSRQMIMDETRRELAAESSRYGRFLPQQAAASPVRTRFFGRLSAGILYDSNASQGPSSSFLQLGHYLIEVANRKKTSTMGGYIGAYFGFYHRLSETGPWAAVGDLNMYVRGNARSIMKETNNREWQTGRVSAGVAYADGRNHFEARAKVEVFDYEFKSRVLASGLELSYSRAVNRNFHLISRAGMEYRDHYRSAFRNGLHGTAGQYARFFWGTPDESGRRHWFMVGGRYYGAGSRTERYRFDAVEVSARANFELPCRFSVSPHVSYAHEQYKGPATVLEYTKRSDNRLRAGVDLEHRFTESWSANVYYQYVKNNSKSALYDYDQHVVGAGMAWGF